MDASQQPAHYLARAVELAVENVRSNGGPFGAIVVTVDGREFAGVNRPPEQRWTPSMNGAPPPDGPPIRLDA